VCVRTCVREGKSRCIAPGGGKGERDMNGDWIRWESVGIFRVIFRNMARSRGVFVGCWITKVIIRNGPQIELIVIRIFLRRWGEEVCVENCEVITAEARGIIKLRVIFITLAA
jgi:hypothetical protein